MSGIVITLESEAGGKILSRAGEELRQPSPRMRSACSMSAFEREHEHVVIAVPPESSAVSAWRHRPRVEVDEIYPRSAAYSGERVACPVQPLLVDVGYHEERRLSVAV